LLRESTVLGGTARAPGLPSDLHYQLKGSPRTTSHRNLYVMFSGIPIHKKVPGIILMEITRSFMKNGERLPFVLI